MCQFVGLCTDNLKAQSRRFFSEYAASQRVSHNHAHCGGIYKRFFLLSKHHHSSPLLSKEEKNTMNVTNILYYLARRFNCWNILWTKRLCSLMYIKPGHRPAASKLEMHSISSHNCILRNNSPNSSFLYIPPSFLVVAKTEY